MREMNDFSVFLKRFNELCGNFLPVWMNMQSVENSSKTSKMLKNFLGQLLKTNYFSMLSQNLIIHAFVFFCAFGWKTQFVGKFCENVHKNIAKNALFLDIFQKNFNKPSVNFCAFGRKTQIVGKFLKKCWKFSKKILLKNWIFILFFENFLLKIEPPEITPVFYNNFVFGFGGGVSPLSPTWLRHCYPWVDKVIHPWITLKRCSRMLANLAEVDKVSHRYPHG